MDDRAGQCRCADVFRLRPEPRDSLEEKGAQSSEVVGENERQRLGRFTSTGAHAASASGVPGEGRWYGARRRAVRATLAWARDEGRREG